MSLSFLSPLSSPQKSMKFLFIYFYFSCVCVCVLFQIFQNMERAGKSDLHAQ